jgi:hypothetical protein
MTCLPSALFAKDSIYFLSSPCTTETIRDIKQSGIEDKEFVLAKIKEFTRNKENLHIYIARLRKLQL